MKIKLLNVIVSLVLLLTLISCSQVTIETEEQAKNYLSNTIWKLSTTVKWDAETFLFHDTKIHFSENAETCYEEFKLDSRLKGGGEWQTFDSASVTLDEKIFFIDKFGKDTNEWYFPIETGCINNHDSSLIFSIFLGSDGKLKYSTRYKGERVT
ncbi:hypothetical protein N9O44_01995, partial [Gammaproteobacteria bacterium]|nr:hypothetical protein [Gammaproteobacteria bacterium]